MASIDLPYFDFNQIETVDDATFATFLWDAEDRLAQRTEGKGQTITWAYDPAHRAKLAAAGGAAGTTSQQFEHDGLGRLAQYWPAKGG